MKKELELRLVEQYPILYQNYLGDPRKTCMCWGFSCGNGWFDIINELSKKLEQFEVVAAQVKEKFGGLRFYIESCPSEYSDEIYDLIDEYEEVSYKICEICGKPGKTINCNHWLKTLCEDCERKE